MSRTHYPLSHWGSERITTDDVEIIVNVIVALIMVGNTPISLETAAKIIAYNIAMLACPVSPC